MNKIAYMIGYMEGLDKEANWLTDAFTSPETLERRFNLAMAKVMRKNPEEWKRDNPIFTKMIQDYLKRPRKAKIPPSTLLPALNT